jgi:hypothetical protein
LRQHAVTAAPNMTNDPSRSGLAAALCDTIRRFHPDPMRVRPDGELRGILLGLYDYDCEGDIWREALGPYLDAHVNSLCNVFAEHGLDPSWSLLDAPEVLMVFERAENDREHLRRVWPGPRSELARVSDVWGVPL